MERMTAAEYQRQYGPEKPKRTKYGAKKCKAWGIGFDSQAERDRYGDLRALQMAGEISNLSPHPKFKLHAQGVSQGVYTADSQYHEGTDIIVEDVKSKATAKRQDYRQKVKLFQACYPHFIFREYLT